jgi:Mycothiol maleylpyruvate isomerase N-terminal domain
MTEVEQPVAAPSGHPYAAEIESENRGWHELVRIVRGLAPAEWHEPGYYRDPDWSVRDAVAHLGTWLAEAQSQFEQMTAGTYQHHDFDIDRINAALLELMADQPSDICWLQANAARSRMVEEWYRLREQNDEAAWWIRKAASDHYEEHLPRLREWVAELLERRGE